MGTRLYLIQYDGQNDYVEAPTFAEAVRIWTEHSQAQEGLCEDGTESFTDQPESVALVSESPVIREAFDGEKADGR